MAIKGSLGALQRNCPYIARITTKAVHPTRYLIGSNVNIYISVPSYVIACAARLTESYYECKRSKLDSFLSAIGLSSATVLSFKVAVILFLTLALSRNSAVFKRSFGNFMTYGTEEREEVNLLDKY